MGLTDRDAMVFNGDMSAAPTTTTHEHFIHGVRDIVVADAIARGTITDEEAATLRATKLVYGVGDGSYRGICYYGAWHNGERKVEAVEIAATAEESWVQLAGTTIHELGHVLAGMGHGHDNDWKDSTVRLGFTKRPEAAGQVYLLSLMRATIRRAIFELAGTMADGSPAFQRGADILGLLGAMLRKPRPCSAGVGARGGRSRGKGSGSRQRKYVCACETHDGRPGPWIVRVASDNFSATCGECESPFERAD